MKQFITDYRLKKYGIRADGSFDDTGDELREDLTNAVEQLATGLYEKDLHFIMELIQNAEDNRYPEGIEPELSFQLLDDDPTGTDSSDGCLCVFNNESGFEQENVKSISSVGKSTKSKIDGYIGEKGIGFKSVYIVSSSPHIFSNGYQFKFYEKDPDFDLNYIVPYWVDKVPEVVRENAAETALLLPLKSKQKQKILDHLGDITPESILFLSKLSGLSVEVKADNSKLNFRRSMHGRHLCEILIDKGNSQEKRQYWLQSTKIDVDFDINEEKRKGINDRTISLALPVSGKSLSGKVFSYLPTEAQSGFPFLVNADFMLTANRESIQTERPWNIWLRNQLSKVVFDTLLGLRKTGELDDKVYGFIPVPSKEESHQFFNVVSEQVCDFLSESDFIKSDNNEIVKPVSVKLPNVRVRALFDFEKKPDWFDHFGFVNQSIEKYAANLGAIGVKRFSVEDLIQCLSDDIWLESRDSHWFLQLYKYLSTNAQWDIDSIGDKAIFPVQTGGIKKPIEGVYWTNTESASAELDRLSVVYNIPKVNFITPDLLKLLKLNNDIFNWLADKFELTVFSLSHYLSRVLLPWMDENPEEIDAKCTLAVTQLIVDQWDLLNEAALNDVGKLLPVLLDDGTVYSQKELPSAELVVPRGYDQDLGWQVIFKEASECSHISALSDEYLLLNYEDGFLSKFMLQIEAQRYPSFRTNTCARYSVRGRYYDQLFRDNNPASTSNITLSTLVAPQFLNKSDELDLKQNRLVLISCLEYVLSRRPSSYFNATLQWYYYQRKIKSVQSQLIYMLRNTAWVMTTLGLKKPAEVFLPGETVKSIFGNSLPYLQDEMSPKLCELLWIKSEATTQSIIGLLMELSSNLATDIKLIKKIYKYLSQYCHGFEDSFNQNKLIYIPGSKNSWYSINEVIWEEAEAAFGDKFGWLSTIYSEFKEFFIDELGVKEQIDDQSVLEAWIYLQNSSESSKKIEAYLSFATPKLIRMIKINNNTENLDHFFEEARIWGQDEEWHVPSWEEVYIPDDQKLRSLFKDCDIHFPWLKSGYTHAQQTLLYERFSLPKISESVEYQVVSQDGFTLRETSALLTERSLLLIFEMIANSDKDDEGFFAKQVETGLVGALTRAKEVQGYGLEIDVTLAKGNTKRLPEVSAFFERASSKLYVDVSAEFDDVKDDVAESLARAIWPRGFKNKIDTLRNLLGITTDKRYKKLHEAKGWSLSNDQRKQLGSIKAKPPETFEKVKKIHSQDNIKEPISVVSDPSSDILTISPVIGIARGDEPKLRHSNGARRSPVESGPLDTNKHRISKKRSKSVNTNQVNFSRRNRMVSYVASELIDDNEKDDSTERQMDRKKLGDAAEKVVFDDLCAKGYNARLMPPNNRGYDIEAINHESGEIFYVEVKGDFYSWSAKGVGISSSQYELAKEKQLNYFLAVVDNLKSSFPNISYIRDPISHITEYRFDHMWSKLASDIVDISSVISSAEMVEELSDLTDDEACKQLILQCETENYPLPDVGIELSNDLGEVIFEGIELVWLVEKVAIVLDQNSLTSLRELEPDWKVFLSDANLLSTLSLSDIFDENT